MPSGNPRGRCNKCDALSEDKRDVQSPRRVDLLAAKARLVGHDEDLEEGSRPSYEQSLRVKTNARGFHSRLNAIGNS